MIGAAMRHLKTEGYRLTRLEAEQGNTKAQITLGLSYSTGRGVTQSDSEATKWFRRAAEQGDGEAQFLLAGQYLFGFGVPQDYLQAHKWANLAVSQAQGEITRQLHLSMLNTVTKRLNLEQISGAQKLAREWEAKPER